MVGFSFLGGNDFRVFQRLGVAVALDDLHTPCLTRVHNVSTFTHCTASRILLDAKENIGTSYFNREFYRKGILKNQRTRRTKNKKIETCRKQKRLRMDLNLSYRIPTKRHRAIPSDHSDMEVLL